MLIRVVIVGVWQGIFVTNHDANFGDDAVVDMRRRSAWLGPEDAKAYHQDKCHLVTNGSK